jgi:hypothetical protein
VVTFVWRGAPLFGFIFSAKAKSRLVLVVSIPSGAKKSKQHHTWKRPPGSKAIHINQSLRQQKPLVSKPHQITGVKRPFV